MKNDKEELVEKLSAKMQRELDTASIDRQEKTKIYNKLQQAIVEYMDVFDLLVSYDHDKMNAIQHYCQLRLALAPANPDLWEGFHQLIVAMPDPEKKNLKKMARLQSLFNDLYYSIRDITWHQKSKGFHLVHTGYGLLKETSLPFGTISGEYESQRHFYKLLQVQDKLFELSLWLDEIFCKVRLSSKDKNLLEKLMLVLDAHLSFIDKALNIRAMRWQNLSNWHQSDEVYQVLEHEVTKIVKKEEEINIQRQFLQHEHKDFSAEFLEKQNIASTYSFDRFHRRLLEEITYDVDYLSHTLAHYFQRMIHDLLMDGKFSQTAAQDKIADQKLQTIYAKSSDAQVRQYYSVLIERLFAKQSTKSMIQVLEAEPKEVLLELYQWFQPGRIFRLKESDYTDILGGCLTSLHKIGKPVRRHSFIKEYSEKKSRKRKRKKSKTVRPLDDEVSQTLNTPQFEQYRQRQEAQYQSHTTIRVHENYAFFVVSDKLDECASSIPNYSGVYSEAELAQKIVEHASGAPFQPICKLK